MDVKPTRWGTMIPLIGGSALGCQKVANILKKCRRKKAENGEKKRNFTTFLRLFSAQPSQFFYQYSFQNNRLAQAAGSLPLFHLSYGAFAANESHLERHWPSVPMFR